MCNDLVGKNLYIQERLDLFSSIIDVGSLIYCDKKLNCIYYGTDLKISLHLHTVQLIQFQVSTRCLRKNQSSLNKEKKIGGGYHPFIKYSHSVDHVPSYNTTLFLRPPDSELPLCHCSKFVTTGRLSFSE